MDIDIALDNMVGKAFAELVNQYYIHLGQQPHTVGVIQTNPDQSKHLETATMKIENTWIDFVNLRTEEYTETRIPTMVSRRKRISIYILNDNKLISFKQNNNLLVVSAEILYLSLTRNIVLSGLFG